MFGGDQSAWLEFVRQANWNETSDFVQAGPESKDDEGGPSDTDEL
jgi:hypothetical protein